MQTFRATNQARLRAATATALAALVAGVLAPGGLAAPSEDYVPFVTDFPRAAEPYVPFVTDFPNPAPAPAPDEALASSHAIAWNELVVGGGLATALLLVAVSWLVSGRRAAPA